MSFYILCKQLTTGWIFQNYPSVFTTYYQLGNQDQLEYIYYDCQLDTIQFGTCDDDGSRILDLIAQTGIKIDLRLYGSVKDLLGSNRIEIDWNDNMCVGDLRQKLYKFYPILSIVNAQFAISINRRAVDDTKMIRKTDELAVLPPISGG